MKQKSLQTFILPSSKTSSSERLTTLKSLSIFRSSANSKEKLFSIYQAESASVFKQALVEPPNCCFTLTNLPHTMVLFSQTDAFQNRLLTYLKVNVLTDTKLLKGYIFPLVRRKSFPSAMLSTLMKEVLDMFQVLQRDDETFSTAISNLPFVDIGSGQTKTPSELYDPTNGILKELFKGEKLFPVSPFDSPKYVQVLKQCGLQEEVSPQNVLIIIDTISLSPSTDPQLAKKTKLRRAKAVLNYISSTEFLRRATGVYTISTASGYLPFKDALDCLARQRSWIPVLAERPQGYPQCLPWKGSPFNSHFVCLRDNVFFSTSTTQISPLMVGSQMFVPDPPFPHAITDLLPERTSQVNYVWAQLKVVIDHADQISRNSLSVLVGFIYQFLNDEWKRRTSSTAFSMLTSIPEWIYIKKCHKFVGPELVALNHNSTFRHDLEPYLWIIPESLLPYAHFLTEHGVSENVTQTQIVSVLKTIRDKVSSSATTTNETDTWGVVMSILNWITADGTTEANLSEDDTLYVPIESDNDLPMLMEADDVVYTDNDFLKNFLKSSDLEDEQFNFVHKRVNTDLAEHLQLSPLSEQLDISEDTFEDTGQQEPLTVRLKTILRDYKDGLTIVKELLQNADDAEATEVNICYDAREHTVEEKSLFFPGMLKSHCPALIVHNNQTFAEEDFVNITKLGGATKLDKPLKIGKFGVGFCSVYHITDIPSFVSQDKLFIFDPTLSCLHKEIKNPALPGKKVKFTSKFISRSKQLSPYEGLFGFNSHKHYNGTLFRFPFRSGPSELSGTCYTQNTVNELMSDIQECGSKLLLFLQHVKKITFQRITSGDLTPTVLLTITKESVDLSIPLSQSTNIKRLQCSLKQSSTDKTCVHHWLVASDSASINGRKACASIASLLDSSSSTQDHPVVDLQGEIFCYLPLSQKTGLPVHVSSNFAVINNRRGIWTADYATSKTDTEVQWNISLMNTVIPNAYHLLLTCLQAMHENDKISEYSFHSLWPLRQELQQRQPWEKFVDVLYEKITSSKLFYSGSTNQWLYLANCKFLKQGLLSQSTEGDSQTPKCVLDVLKFLKIPTVELPNVYHVYFNLENKVINDIEFVHLFFKNLKYLTDIITSRNKAILCLLVVFATESDGGGLSEKFQLLSQNFQLQPSIPSSPDGHELKQCEALIDPQAPFAELFESEKNHFPVSMLTSNRRAMSALKTLGVISIKLPWSMLIERAQASIDLHLSDKPKAFKHIKLILDTITSHMDGDPPSVGVRIESVKFLPVLKKPTGYPLSWKGERHTLLSGEEMMTAQGASYSYEEKSVYDNVCIVGSQVSFLCEKPPENDGCGYISYVTRNALKIRTIPTCFEVITHFQKFIEVFNSQSATDEIKWANLISREVYAFLDTHISSQVDEQQNTEQIDSLQALPCVWTGKEFISTKVIAKQWKHNGPYLYPVPPSMSDKEDLLLMLQVKEEFTESDIQSALVEMKAKFGDKPIDDPCKALFEQLIPLLLKIKPEEFSNFKIILPDEQFILRWSPELAYNDAPWAPKDDDHVYVHGIVSRDLAKQLHVNPVRSKLLEKYVTLNKMYFRGSEFGQREELTRRIQNILREYPFDITILKELLQNADDAKATKMYIILDKRTHGIETVLSEEWPKLQGPALLVWNDSTFSEKDLKGIQELGLGSKRSDAESIGQYGIGFNVVYHLTDCPSFVTGGETLCIMDPHCNFVPGADPMNPGRRYDDLEKKGFWRDFPDMRSAYLRCGLDNGFKDLLNGSLFRFPLRHTEELVNLSKLLEHDPTPLTVDTMLRNLHSWAPEMKEAMLFLNHVTELRFFIIEEEGRNLVTIRHFTTQVDPSAQSNRAELYDKLKAFKQSGCEPHVVRYPLTITEMSHSGTESKKEEKWLIQQGVGNINNRQQMWQYVENVKPRHGLAAPLTLLKRKQTSSLSYSSPSTSAVPSGFKNRPTFSGKIFCFLPLPVESKLPVHINGHFVLSSNRRQLWHSTDPNQHDDRTRWNTNLLNAVASSYTNLLEHAQKYCITLDVCKSWSMLKESVNLYYELFPDATSDGLDKLWLSLAKDVYRTLLKHNPSILAVITKVASPHAQVGHEKFKIDWHCLRSEDKSNQVYFWTNSGGYDRKCLQPILEKTGMKITNAPYRVKSHFNGVLAEKEYRLPSTTPQSVFAYYTQYYKKVSSSGFPADIKETSFVTVEDFKMFTRYLLLPKGSCCEFPSNPFGYPLLLTADSKLRLFIADEKTLFSKFSELFPKSQSKFLHSQFLDINYSSAYFLSCSLDNSEPGRKLVHSILHHELPTELRASCVLKAEEYISQGTLAKLWECFMNDSVFKTHLSSIIRELALILTTENDLYSTSNRVLPVYPPNADDENKNAYRVLQQIKMPFVLEEVVCAPPGVLCSPTLSDPTSILKNLYHLNAGVDLSSLLNKEQVEILTKYIKGVNFRSPDCCTHLKSLPLFETIDDSFSPIANKVACAWPPHMCKSGYKKWVAFHNVVFLKKDAAWEILRASEVLQIESICEEDIYTRYIFPRFGCMNEKERYAHLKHIRDHLYRSNAYYKHSGLGLTGLKTSAARAIRFLDALSKLPCLGEDGNTLRPVSSFCSPHIKIFQVFAAHFLFLPKIFTKDSKEGSRWIEFFIGIGLRVSITQSEYLQFCKDTANGRVEDIPKSSSVLVEYLFDEQAEKDHWHQNTYFLSQVSQIAYVCTEQLPKYAWIAPVVCPSKKVQQANRTVYMTHFCAAIVSSQSNLIWTVKPVVSVTHFYRRLIPLLRITEKPSVKDVLQNIAIITKKGKFSDFKLFDNYPETLKQPPKCADLMEVMLKTFEFLQKEQQQMFMAEEDKRYLSVLPCIPVFSTASKTHKWQLVLVKPKFVLTSDVGSKFHPFLHQLPDVLLTVVPLLRVIGVKNSVDMHHMQTVLQKAYECSEDQDLDVNTEKCIVSALKTLNKFLIERKESEKVLSDADLVTALSPLYLPNTEKKLFLSTSLVHDDVSEYGGSARVTLGDTGLAKLDLKACEFPVSRFCNLLPEAVRPKLLTQICHETISPECENVEDSDTAKNLKQTLEMPSIPKAALLVVKHGTKDEKLCTALKPVLLKFLPSIKIVTVKNLKTVFKMKDTGRHIGSARNEFFFQCEHEGEPVLYLDSKLKNIMRDLAIAEIAAQVMKEVRKLNPNVTYSSALKDIAETLKLLLKAETTDDVKSILGTKRLTLDSAANSDEQEMEDIKFELGKVIPECWHHRLDQDNNNIFNLMEYVGYEEEEGKVIFAQILYPVLPDGATDFESIPHLDMKYKIRIVKGDATGVTASVLDLYKFLRGLKHEPEAAETDEVSTALEGESDATKVRNQLKKEDLKTIKKELCKELQEIWKLPEDKKKKAIKRLYFKWHPDKNPDNPDLAEEVFKFLRTQIDHLEAGHPLDDPEGEPSPAAPRSSRWSSDFYQWAYTARQQANYQRSEYNRTRRGRRRPQSSRGCSGANGGGVGGRGWSGFFFTTGSFKPHKKPQEGRKWLRQAEADFHAVNVLYDQVQMSVELSCHVCYLAYQVAEKALKGVLFIECGLDEEGLKRNRIVLDASILSAACPTKTAGLNGYAHSLASYNSNILQPSSLSGIAPADKYNPADAAQAKQNAEGILQMMKNIACMA